MANETNPTIQNNKGNVTVFSAYNKIPYAILNSEVDGSATEVLREMGEIQKLYSVYKKGMAFTPEGSGGHYLPADLRYKKTATLINKEARFLFCEMPDIKIKPQGNVEKTTDDAKDNVQRMQSLVNKILKENKFESILLKAARDCFIGKRVALVANFNEEFGVTVSFLPSLNFVYETRMDNTEILTKFVCFTTVKNKVALDERRIFKKKYILLYEKDEETGDESAKPVCYIEEGLYDGRGVLVEEVTPLQPTLLDRIPVSIIVNDGLTGEVKGESEVELLSDYEKWFSRLSNADIDSERKNMNPVKYTVDMDTNSTKSLSTSPGSFWDLLSDQNLDHGNPSAGILESSMSYSQALSTTLQRIKASMHEEVDIPDISLESMAGVITSGKALKAIYWPLIVRCKEKMKVWGPAIEYIIKIIIEGAMLYPDTIKKYTEEVFFPSDYEINIEVNYPLPEDEIEEKEIDLAEVSAQTLSKKSYMKKWRLLTDSEADEELEQIALELSMLEMGTSGLGGETEVQMDDDLSTPVETIDDEQQIDEPEDIEEDTKKEVIE
jgi:hypothetical protein